MIGTTFTLQGQKFKVVAIVGQYAHIDSKTKKTCIHVGLLKQHLERHA